MDSLLGPSSADIAVIGALGQNTRPNVLELSRQLGIARNTVQARLNRLQTAGVIAGYAPMIDLAALGYNVLAFTTLEIVQGQEQTLLDGLRAMPEVLETHKITGPGDLLCRIVARSNEHLHDVLEQVLSLGGIGRTTTALALASPIQHLHPRPEAVGRLS